MSICTNFNCYLAASFSQKDQKIAREVLRNIRKQGISATKLSNPLHQSDQIQSLLNGITQKQILPQLEPVFDSASKLGIRIITILDDDYPTSLLDLHDPPFCIFLLSKNSDFKIPTIEQNLCVVGSRTATSDAVSITKSLASKAAIFGLCIVSGLASGIDVAAHEGCLQNINFDKMIAVLGNDVSECFPAANTNIYKKILSNGGAIVSEYPPGTAAMKHQFIARNRIMAALSKCTIIVQAKEKSGALHTARNALDLGRDVAVLPWSLSVHAAKGSNLLLREGAHPILSFDDIVEMYSDIKRGRSNKDGLDAKTSSRLLNNKKFQPVINYLSDYQDVSSVALKELFNLSEVDLITLEMELIIKRSPTSIITLA